MESVTICTKEALKKLSHLNNPPDVLALFETQDEGVVDLASFSKAIYLDDVQDPGNVGTIIRVADWYGVELVARSEGSADFYNVKVVQATMGSLGHVRLKTIPKESFATTMTEYHCVGATMDAGAGSIGLGINKVCLVVGNEGHGISPEIMPHLDNKMHIPGAESRQADSLNAAIATGILCQMLFDPDL